MTRYSLCVIFDLSNEWRVKFKMKKSLWEISGWKLETLFIEADSFDEALKIAREADNGFGISLILVIVCTIQLFALSILNCRLSSLN